MLLTVKEASEKLVLHPKTLYKWAKQGKIPYLSLKGCLRFDSNALDTWLKGQKVDVLQAIEFPFKLEPSLRIYDKIFLKGGRRGSMAKKTRWNYGFGAVYIRRTKPGNERWYIDFQNEKGERIQRVAKFARNRGEALIELQTEVAQCFAKGHPSSLKTESICISEFVDLYIENYAKVNKKSWKDDKCRLSKFVNFAGKVPLCEVTALEIEKFKAERLQEGLAKSTINRYLAILKRMFTIAIDWGYAHENPVKKVKFFSGADNLMERILSLKEERLLLQASSEHLFPILQVALHTGMRRGEILNLEWSQVDLQSREIRVEKTKSGKTRIVDINSRLFTVLSKLRSQSKDDQHVFLNPKTGKPYGKLQKSFKAACRKAGIDGLRFHDLRHTFASRLIEKGVDIIRVKELLGHSTVKITERYTHSNREERKKAVELLCETPLENAENGEILLHRCDTASQKENSAKLISLFSVN